MRYAVVVLALLVYVLAPASVHAQGGTQAQSKFVYHPTVTLKGSLIAAGWVIVNQKDGDPDNLNLFAGSGVKREHWRLEVLAHRQFASTGNNWAGEVRFFHRAGCVSSFAEASRSLTSDLFYEFVLSECYVTKRLALGGEMENLRFPGDKDMLGGGPRVNFVLLNKGGQRLAMAWSYQFRHYGSGLASKPHAGNWSRIYLALNSDHLWR
jgi:hypothetical protein